MTEGTKIMTINKGKCPKCDNHITKATLEEIVLDYSPFAQYKGVSCICPHCSYVISVFMDPMALKFDTVNEVLAELRQGS